MNILQLKDLKKLPIEKVNDLEQLNLEKAYRVKNIGNVYYGNSKSTYYGKYFKITNSTDELTIALNPKTHIQRISEDEFVVVKDIINKNFEIHQSNHKILINELTLDLLIKFLSVNSDFLYEHWINSWLGILKKLKKERELSFILK